MKTNYQTLATALKAAKEANNDATMFLVVDEINGSNYLYEFTDGVFVLEPQRVFSTWSQYETYATIANLDNVVTILYRAMPTYIL